MTLIPALVKKKWESTESTELVPEQLELQKKKNVLRILIKNKTKKILES